MAPRTRFVLLMAILLLVAWGVLAFGSVYVWAYVPLLGGCGLVGLACLRLARGRPWARTERRVVTGVLLLLLAAGVQLVPLPPAALRAVSPGVPRFLEGNDLSYLARALPSGVTDPALDVPAHLLPLAWHPLSLRPAGTLTGLACAAALCLFAIGLLRSLGQLGLRRLAQGLVVLGVIVACIGIVQKSTLGDVTYDGMRIYGFWQPESLLTTPFGPFVNKNHYAGWMLMALPVAFGCVCALLERARREHLGGVRERILWLSTAEGGQLLLLVLSITLMAAALLMTRSRSGLASFAVALLLAAVLGARITRNRGGRAGVVGLFLLLLALPLAWVGLDVALGRFPLAGAELQLRLDGWSRAARIIAEFPVTGSGLNTFGLATVPHEIGSPVHFEQAHNDYLQLLAEGGVLLAVPVLCVVVALARAIRTRLREESDVTTRWLRVGAVIGLVAIALQSLVEFSLQMPGNAVLCVVLAAAAAHAETTHDPVASRHSTPSAHRLLPRVSTTVH